MMISVHTVLSMGSKLLLTTVLAVFGMSVRVHPVGDVSSSPIAQSTSAQSPLSSSDMRYPDETAQDVSVDSTDLSASTPSDQIYSSAEQQNSRNTSSRAIKISAMSMSKASPSVSSQSTSSTINTDQNNSYQNNSTSSSSYTVAPDPGVNPKPEQTDSESVSVSSPASVGGFGSVQEFVDDVVHRTTNRQLYIGDYAGRDLDQIYSLLCVDQPLCAKVSFQGSMSQEEKVIYTALFVHLVQRLDTHMQTNRSVGSTIQQLLINKTSDTVKYCSKEVRGCSSHTIVELNLSDVSSVSEGFEVLTHELGHIIDLGVLRGKSSNIDPDYTEFGTARFATDDPSIAFYRICRSSETIRKADCDDRSFAGGYAMTNPFEDRAEVFNLYLNHRSMLIAMSETSPQLKQKFRIMDRLFGGQSIAEIPVGYRSDTARSRDTTRL